MLWAPTCLSCCVLFISTIVRSIEGLDNILCDPYPKVIELNPGENRFYPYFVNVTRCQGGGPSKPDGFVCSPTQQRNESVTSYDASNPNDPEVRKVEVPVHIKCKFQCEGDASQCNMYQRWDTDECRCKCTQDQSFACANTKHVFSSTHCECACDTTLKDDCAMKNLVINEDTCECMKGSASKDKQCDGMYELKWIIILAVGELIVVSLVWIILFKYCCKGDDEDLKERIPMNGEGTF